MAPSFLLPLGGLPPRGGMGVLMCQSLLIFYACLPKVSLFRKLAMDLIYLFTGLAFFAASAALVLVFEKVRRI